MCGVCGVVSFTEPPDLGLLTEMMRRLTHRGPDGSGYFRDRHAALGHTTAGDHRSGRAAPSRSPTRTRRVWVTFNGEIFNYVELASRTRRAGAQLPHGERHARSSSTPGRQWGADCFERFNGQWAIALWDCGSRRLVLSRDRLGVRPLYLRQRPADRSCFASEVKAIFADPSVPRAFDPRARPDLHLLVHRGAPHRVRGHRAAPPGPLRGPRRAPDSGPCRTGAISSRPRDASRLQDLDANAEELRERARRGQLACDSSAATSRSAPTFPGESTPRSPRRRSCALHRRAPATFSLRFTDPEFDEGAVPARDGRRLGTEHRTIEVSAADIARVFPEVVWHAETAPPALGARSAVPAVPAGAGIGLQGGGHR